MHFFFLFPFTSPLLSLTTNHHRGEHVAVCSIEKANNCVSRLLCEGRLHELCCVVVDELHLLGDPSRGQHLEMLLTKLMLHRRQHPDAPQVNTQ